MARSLYKNLHIYITLISIICMFLYYIKKIEGFQDKGNPTIDLVVARYEEDLSWLNMLPLDSYSRIFIYNKGSENDFNIPRAKVLNLQNVGREGHTYLRHIVNNYNTLPDVTFFVPGSGQTNKEKMRRIMKISEYLKENKTSIILGHKDKRTIDEANDFSINEWKSSNIDNLNKNPESNIQPASERPLKLWFRNRFVNEEEINCVAFLGIVAASREDIQKRPKEFYHALSEEMLSSNPETGHYIERIWKHTLSIADDKCLPV